MSNNLKKLTPLIAIILVVVVVVNTVWVGAAQVSIQRTETDDAQGNASNYLVDNTSYVSRNTLERMYEVLAMYQTPSDWQGYEEQAGIFIAKEKYEKALECIGKAVELSDTATDAEKASLWLQKGCLHTIRGEYEEALEALEKSVTYNPESSECYLILAQIYLEQGDEEKTLLNMEAYLELNPGNAEAEAMIGQLYMAKQDYTTAKKWLKQAQESSGSAEAYYQYGLCSIQESNFEEAEEYLSKALEVDDTIEEAYYYRGICRLTTGAYEEALEDLRQAEERTENETLKAEITNLLKELTNT